MRVKPKLLKFHIQKSLPKFKISEVAVKIIMNSATKERLAYESFENFWILK